MLSDLQNGVLLKGSNFQNWCCIFLVSHPAVEVVLLACFGLGPTIALKLGFAKLLPLLRYGEKNPPFIVAHFENNEEDADISLRISQAVDKATSDYHSGTSSDEESTEPRTIPTVSNPNSVYQVRGCMQWRTLWVQLRGRGSLFKMPYLR